MKTARRFPIIYVMFVLGLLLSSFIRTRRMHQHSLFGEMSGETFSEHSRQQLRDVGGYTREVPK